MVFRARGSRQQKRCRTDVEGAQSAAQQNETVEATREASAGSLGSKGAVDTHGYQCSCCGRNRVDVRDLAERIEERDEKDPRKPPNDRRCDDLERDQDGTLGAAVGVGQMPPTARTGGHQLLQEIQGHNNIGEPSSASNAERQS